MNVLFLDSCHPALKQELENMRFSCEEDFTSSKEEVQRKIGSYQGIVIRSRFKLDDLFLDHCTALRFIARVGAGMENINVAYARSKGIACLHAPEGNRDAVGEHAIGMLLCLFRNIARANKEVRKGKWIREANRGYELGGKTVGIIGYGNTGSAFAKKLRGFDCTVLAYDKYKKNFSDGLAKEAAMDELFERTDILSLHLPLTEETTYLVNDAFISRFKKSIYVINTARGKIIRTDDLVKNMRSGKVLGACLDVLEYEALSFEELDRASLPPAFRYLAKSKRTLLTSHIGGWTFESNEKMARVLAEKIRSLFA
ncbi:MAG: NAD(P)-dependent oxidoreductase [Bacteroidota bacterium]